MAKLDFNYLRFKELEKCVNYFEAWPSYQVDDNGKYVQLEENKLEADGHNLDDDWPFSIEDVEKLGYKFEGEMIECDGGDVTYYFDVDKQSISIESDKFTLKEAIVILDLVRAQLKADIGRCYEVIFGHTSDNEHFTHYHQEATAYGLWWTDFLELYQEKIDDISSIEIYLEDSNKLHIVMYKKEE